MTSTTSSKPAAAFDAARVRSDFPILARSMRGRPLVYLDSAATSQKPRVVIDAVQRFYAEENANIHRGVYALSEQATLAFERARRRVQVFLNAASPSEIVFVRGTTEAINLVAAGLRPTLGPGDEILLSGMEHHSNIVPWQLVAAERGARIQVLPIDDRGELILDGLEQRFGPATRMVALTHVSNALGTVNPVAEVAALARARGIPVLIDGAQAAPHLPIDVQAIGCDFYAFSGHKVFGPTGIGALYGRKEALERLPPWQGGGDMIETVTFEGSTFAPVPQRFEAGTPHIAGAIGLDAALTYLMAQDREAVLAHEDMLVEYAAEALLALPGVRLIGTASRRTGVVSFVVEGIHPHDIGTVLDREGVAIRAGHHCSQPVMDRFAVPATARASFAMYNTRDDVDRLITGLRRVIELFGHE